MSTPQIQEQQVSSPVSGGNSSQLHGMLHPQNQQQSFGVVPTAQPPSPSQSGFPPQQLYPGQQSPYSSQLPTNPPFQQQPQSGHQSPYHPPSPSLQPQQQPPQFPSFNGNLGMMPQMLGMPLQPQSNMMGAFPQQQMPLGQPPWATQFPNMDPNQMQQMMQMLMAAQQQQQPGAQNPFQPQPFIGQQAQWAPLPPQMMGMPLPPGQQHQQWQPLTGGYIPPPNIGSTDPSWASLGYKNAYQDPQVYPPNVASQDMEIIVKAFKSTNTDEKALISVLSGQNFHPLNLASIRQAYRNSLSHIPGKEIVDVANSKKLNFADGFKYAVTAILYGPLQLDSYLLNRAIDGVGTIEKILDLVLLGRKNADIVAIKHEYAKMFKKDLIKDLKGDLSGDVLELFLTAVEARREYEDLNTINAMGAAHWDKLVESDCKELYTAMVGSAEGIRVSNLFVTRSDLRLKAVSENYRKYTPSEDTLERVVKKKFRGHMEDALLHILKGAIDRAKRDAELISESLNAGKTWKKFDKDEQLAVRIVKLAWEECAQPGYMAEVKGAYLKHFARPGSKDVVYTLESEVKEKTKGDFRNLLCRLLSEDERTQRSRGLGL